MIAGTSTGGILSLGLRVPDLQTQRPRYRTQELFELYTNKGELIFPRAALGAGWFSSKYDNAPLKNLCKSYFGNLSLRDLSQPTVVVSYDLHQEDRVLFESDEARRLKSKNFKLKDVALATSAAPTFLPAVKVESDREPGDEGKRYTLVDGGLSANNPTLIAYTQAHALYPGESFHFISLGCGASNLFTLDAKKQGGKLSYAGDISSVLLNATSQATHKDVERLAATRGDTYTRIQFTLDRKLEGLDDTRPENISYLKGQVEREIQHPSPQLKEIKAALMSYLKEHRFYVYGTLLEEVERVLVEHPSTLSLQKKQLNARSLWEIQHALKERASQIQELDLSENTLTPSTLTWLASFKGLQRLNLRKTGLDAEGFKMLSGLKLPLKQLRLDGNLGLEQVDVGILVQGLEGIEHPKLDALLNGRLGKYMSDRKNYDRAFFYYQHSLGLNSPADLENQVALADLYLLGIKEGGTQPSMEAIGEGYKLLSRLSGEGYAEAQYRLGHLYRASDQAVWTFLLTQYPSFQNKQDPFWIQKAADAYQQAADQGHKSAARRLGDFYRDALIKVEIPRGAPKDARHHLQKALHYYRLAEQAGSTTVAKDIQAVEAALEKLQ